jgi:hypothetical protein
VLPILLAPPGDAPGDGAGDAMTVGRGDAVRGARGLPAIVFVSRDPVSGEPEAIPGLGPHRRAEITGGRLLVRERDGRLRELVSRDAFIDVSDPSVSPAARRIAFAGVTRPDGNWRIWVVGLDGRDLRQVTFDGDGGEEPARIPPGSAATRFDDLDPCWTDDSTLVFASTRLPQRAQYADVPVTNLYMTCLSRAPGRECTPRRITAERNGAEEPAMDWTTGRLLFSRWWFNRHRAADTAFGLTTDPAAAIARDTVNLWQAMEMSPVAQRPRLAAGDLRTRRGTMGYQPAVLADGSIAAVYAANLGLSPRPGGTGIHVLPRRFARALRLAGAIVSGRAGDAYGGTEGLAPPSACSPAGLPDGRVLFSYSPGARGDFGLYRMDANGARITRVLDLPGTLELDGAPIVRRAPLRREPAPVAEDYEDQEAFARRADPAGSGATFRFHDLDVFADGPPGSPARGAAPRTPGARIRFFATLARPEREGGDTAVLVREAPVGPNGEVNERGLPAHTPMFEQLVGPNGRVLMTAHGPAHVAGSNAGAARSASRCVGCHMGHSTLPLGATGPRAKGAAR